MNQPCYRMLKKFFLVCVTFIFTLTANVNAVQLDTPQPDTFQHIENNDQPNFPYYNDVNPEEIAYTENLRIGTSWLEMKNYAKAYHYLNKAYQYNEEDDETAQKLRNLSLLLHRITRLKQYANPHAIGAELVYSTESGGFDPNEMENWLNRYQTFSRIENKAFLSGYLRYAHPIKQRCKLTHTLEYQHSIYEDVLWAKESEGTEKYDQRQKRQSVNYSLLAQYALPKEFTLSLIGRFFLSFKQHSIYKLNTPDGGNAPFYPTIPDNPYWNDDWNNDWNRFPYYPYSHDDFNYDTDYDSQTFGQDITDTQKTEDEERFAENSESERTPLFTQSSTREKDFLFCIGAIVQKNYKQHEFTMGVDFLRLYKSHIFQINTTYLWMPWGNLNLYSKTEFSYLWRKKKGMEARIEESDRNDKPSLKVPLIEETIGFKTFNFLWMELAFLYGNLYGYADFDANIVYLSNESTRFRASALFYLYLRKDLNLCLTYRMTGKREKGIGADEAAFHLESEKSHNHTVSVGIKWKF